MFNPRGEMLARKLEKGEAPDQSMVINKYLHLVNGQHLIMQDWNLDTYNPQWFRVRRRVLDFNDKTPEQQLAKSPRGDMRGIYEFDWMRYEDQGLLQVDSGTVLFPLKTYHPLFNGYQHAEYYKEARILGKVDLNTGRVTAIFGEKSPLYSKGKLYPNFDFFHFALRRDTVLVSFAIDPVVYEYVNDKLVGGFGCPGAVMQNQAYTSYTDYEEADRNRQKDLREIAHYSHLFYDDEKDLLFRSYNRGFGKGGLQVFKGKKLIGDGAVPYKFKVIGRIGDKYYADGIKDEEGERLGVYTFELPANTTL